MNRYVFEIDESDIEKLETFETQHKESCWSKYHDISGALFSYTFIPTGIGLAATVECSCGEKIHLYGGMD